MQEQTAFEETIAENQAIVPSFTLCPQDHHDSVVESIENFDDVAKAIENSKFKYIIIEKEVECKKDMPMFCQP